METNKIKLKIGEFSKLNQVTVKTLRLYEQIGLLIPCQKDEWTGYRYYNIDQMKTMTKIVCFKRLGFSLDEIRDMFDDGLMQPTDAMIESKIDACAKEQQLINWRYNELIKLKTSLKNESKMENAVEKTLPAIIVASCRRSVNSYQDLFNLCPNVIGPEMKRLGCKCPEPGYCYTIDHSENYQDHDIDIEYCEEVVEKLEDSDMITFKEIPEVKRALCFEHRGSYRNFPQTWVQVFDYLEKHNLKMSGSPRFCYIDGIWNKDDERQWLSQIQVPVE